MAFCKHCGTEYPDGGSCPNPACPGAQQAAAPTGSPLDGGFNEAVEHVKKNKGVIIGAIIAVIVLVLVIVFLGGHMGAKGAANKYAKNLYKKNGFKATAKVTMLDDSYKEFKSDDDFDDEKDAYKDGIEALKDNDCKIKVKSVKKGRKLKKQDLKEVKQYFKSEAKKYDVDDDIEIKKGYEYKVKVKIKADGEKSTETFKIWVVKVKGNGWKVYDKYHMNSMVTMLGGLSNLDLDEFEDMDLDDMDLDDYDLSDFDF